MCNAGAMLKDVEIMQPHMIFRPGLRGRGQQVEGAAQPPVLSNLMLTAW